MYVQRNIETLSFNHGFTGKEISITYCECVFVALGIQQVMCMRHIVICTLPGSTIFFHITLHTARSSKKLMNKNVSFDFLYNFCLIHFSV
jgi:hypothetical protein